jgi:tumor protein p53-inducible protein 3
VVGDFFDCNLESLGMDSRWVIYGFMGGSRIKQTNLSKLMAKRASIMTTTLRNRTDEYKSELIRDMISSLKSGFETGSLKPQIDREFKMSEAA